MVNTVNDLKFRTLFSFCPQIKVGFLGWKLAGNFSTVFEVLKQFIFTCGMLAMVVNSQANVNIICPRLSASSRLNGWRIAKYLSRLITTSTKDDKYKHNARKNMSILQP